MATLVLGGVNEELEGLLVFKKADFTIMPTIGKQFIFNGNYLRVETITTESGDPTFTVGFSKVRQGESTDELPEPTSGECTYLSGGDVLIEHDSHVTGGSADHHC